MALLTSFKGRITRQEWWKGILALILVLFVWSIASGLAMPAGFGPTLSALGGLALLIPLAALCAKRLRDLGRDPMPTAALLVAPLLLHGALTGLTNLGSEETIVPSGIADAQLVVAAPTVFVWALLAASTASILWMVLVLGIKGTDTTDTAPQTAQATA